jgi:hypothetical protein
MSYLHIENLYKARDIMLFKECYAMEKIHGTSAHVGWNGKLYFFSGGESYDMFVELFDKDKLTEHFSGIGHDKCIIYGEAYGGKCQGMRKTYGDKLRFVAFEVMIGERWLCVPAAEAIVTSFGLDFVPYEKIQATIESLNAWRDMPSQQSVKNGIIEERMREGIVVRPIEEFTRNNGGRVIAKHKNELFAETKTPRLLADTEEKLAILSKAQDIAAEWVTEMRLTHVLDKFPGANVEQIPDILRAMNEDIIREAGSEIVFSKEASREISKQTATMFKQRLNNF